MERVASSRKETRRCTRCAGSVRVFPKSLQRVLRQAQHERVCEFPFVVSPSNHVSVEPDIDNEKTLAVGVHKLDIFGVNVLLSATNWAGGLYYVYKEHNNSNLGADYDVSDA